MGPYDIGDRNNRVEPLLQFAQEKGNNTKNKQAQQEVDLDITRRYAQRYAELECCLVIGHVAYGLILPPLAA